MFEDWSWYGKLVLLALLILLGVVILPVFFVYNENYPEYPLWDMLGLIPGVVVLLGGAAIVDEIKKKGSSLKSRELCMFFALVPATIVCSTWGYAATQATLDNIHFTALVENHPVNLAAGSQAWNYSFPSEDFDDLLITIDSYATAPYGTAARLQYSWTIYQGGTRMYGNVVNASGLTSCGAEDSSCDRSAQGHWYLWNFKKTAEFNISIAFAGTSFPENSEESVSFAIYGTTNFSGMWVKGDLIRVHFGIPLVLCSASVVITLISCVVAKIENWRRRSSRKEIVWTSGTKCSEKWNH